jgi:integrase
MNTATFMSLLKEIITKLEDGSILNYGKKFSNLTITSYRQVYNQMSTYKFNFNIESLDLNNVTNRKDRLKVTRNLQTQVNKYLNMMLDDCKHHNTRKNHLKIIRTTLKKAEDYYGFMFPKLQSMRELQTEVIALSPTQVELIHNNKPGIELEDVWYYTRLMLYSCMRVSDLVNFKASSDGSVVTIITKKGVGSISSFYLPKDVRVFLEGKGAFTHSQQHFRARLKTLLKSYKELHEKKIIYTYDHNGNPIHEEKFLYDIITPHKLRASGITYHLSKGLSEIEARNISGHSNGSTAFYRYVKHSNTESIEKQKQYSLR